MLGLAAPVALAALATAALGATTVQVAFPPAPTHGTVNSNFLGLSVELSFFNIYFGNDSNSVPDPIVNHLRAIRNHTGSDTPLRFRLGGNSMDSATYKSDQAEMLIFTNPEANVNDQPVDFGPVLWSVMRTVGDKIGGARYLVGLSLLAPNDTRWPGVPEMAGAAYKALGDDLDAFVLGNEPDLYTDHDKRPQYENYTTAIYTDEFQKVVDALKTTPEGDVIGNGPNIAAPSMCCGNWELDPLLKGGWLDQFKNNLKYIALQHYPQNYCFGSYRWGVDYYQKHNEVTTLARWQSAGVETSVGANKEVIMTEFNSVSCGGVPKVSDTFAVGALWTLDYALQLATVGFTAAYVHTRERGVSYNIIDPPTPAGAPGKWDTLPVFYAMLVAPEVFGAGNASRIVDLNVDNGMWTAGPDGAGYAAYDAGSGAVARLALFNYANASTGADGAKAFALPKDLFANASALAGADAKQVRVKYLSAASETEKWDISYGGLTYNGVGDGVPVADKSGRPTEAIVDCSEGCSIAVPAPGMAVVFVSGETSFSGASASGSASATNPSSTSTAGSNSGAVATGVSAGVLGLLALTSAVLLL